MSAAASTEAFLVEARTGVQVAALDLLVVGQPSNTLCALRHNKIPWGKIIQRFCEKPTFLYTGLVETFMSYGLSFPLALGLKALFSQAMKDGPELPEALATFVEDAAAVFCASLLVSTPVERVIVLKQLAAQRGESTALLKCVQETFKAHGARGLWQGFSFLTARDISWLMLITKSEAFETRLIPAKFKEEHPNLAYITSRFALGVLLGGATNVFAGLKNISQGQAGRVSIPEAYRLWRTESAGPQATQKLPAVTSDIHRHRVFPQVHSLMRACGRGIVPRVITSLSGLVCYDSVTGRNPFVNRAIKRFFPEDSEKK